MLSKHSVNASKNLRGRKAKTGIRKKKRKGKCVGGFAESYPVKSEAKDQNDKTKPPVKRLLWVRVTQMGIPEEFFWQGAREGG